MTLSLSPSLISSLPDSPFPFGNTVLICADCVGLCSTVMYIALTLYAHLCPFSRHSHWVIVLANVLNMINQLVLYRVRGDNA
jgi:uncharacterized membrane protein